MPLEDGMCVSVFVWLPTFSQFVEINWFGYYQRARYDEGDILFPSTFYFCAFDKSFRAWIANTKTSYLEHALKPAWVISQSRCFRAV